MINAKKENIPLKLEELKRRRQAETDLKINELAEIENETILIHLENQNEMILEILKNMEQRSKQTDAT